jgi:hypothetical protein
VQVQPTQVPPVQISLAVQLLPQAPQWLASLCRLMQVPSQTELSSQQAPAVVSWQTPSVILFESNVTAPFASQRPAVESCVGEEADAGQREDVPLEGGAGADRCRAAHLPEDVAGAGAVMKRTDEPLAVVSLLAIWKMKSGSARFSASSTSVPDSWASEVKQ